MVYRPAQYTARYRAMVPAMGMWCHPSVCTLPLETSWATPPADTLLLGNALHAGISGERTVDRMGHLIGGLHHKDGGVEEFAARSGEYSAWNFSEAM